MSKVSRRTLITIIILILFGFGVFSLSLGSLNLSNFPAKHPSLTLRDGSLYQVEKKDLKSLKQENSSNDTQDFDIEVPEDTNPGSMPVHKETSTTDEDCTTFEDCYGDTDPEEFEDPNQKPPQGR
jgi:hypothetical protein